MKPIKPFTPLQYIMGKTKFFGLDFEVNDDVLIPRPETEVLVQTVLDIVNHESCIVGRNPFVVDRKRILDLGTGAGNIAISLTKHAPLCKIFASELSDGALRVARRNAELNGVADKIVFIKSDLFKSIDGKFDIIASNPPYIARHEFPGLQKEVLMEPRIALDGGEDGLDFYRRIIDTAPGYLNDGGYIVMELGYGQAPLIKKIIESRQGFKFLEVKEDQYVIERIVVAKWKN
jgi:release factor glutamine methyltransferase